MLAWLSVALASVPDTVEKKSGLPQLNTFRTWHRS